MRTYMVRMKVRTVLALSLVLSAVAIALFCWRLEENRRADCRYDFEALRLLERDCPSLGYLSDYYRKRVEACRELGLLPPEGGRDGQ